MRIADCAGYRALSKIIVLLILLPRTGSQRFPATDQDDRHDIFGVHREELYFDTGLLPYEREVTDYLRHNVSKEVFINVDKDKGPLDLKLTITPCASPVEVTISRNTLPPGQHHDNPKSRDPFLEQAYHTQLSGSGAEVLARLQGAARQQWTLPNAGPGVFKVRLEARLSDTYVKLLLSAQPHVAAYPRLPALPQVEVVSVSRHSIAIQWPPAPPAPRGQQQHYCVSLSRLQPLASHCAALSHLHGDRPPRLPASVGFGFQHEKEARRREQQRARPRKPAPRGQVAYACVGSKTSYTFSGLRPGRAHFLDVFVVDSATNMSSAYRGANVSTEARASRKRKVVLRDGERVLVTVRRPQDGGERQAALVFRVQDTLPQALLEVTSCRGTLTFDIYHRDKLVYRSTVRRRKLVHVKHMPPGPYFLRFSSRRRRSKASVFFTSSPASYRPPRLPKDKRVREFENLTTCNSVTLGWVAARLKQRYCVYRREVTGPRDVRRFRRLSCAASRGRGRGQRVRCVRVRAADRDRAVVTQVVTGLKPDTQYQFDVYASRGRGTARSYVSLLTRTKAQC